MKTRNRMLLAALVSTSLGVLAVPALADPDQQSDGRQYAHFDDDGDRGRFMRGPHGQGRGGPPGLMHFHMLGVPGMGRHGGPIGPMGQQPGGPMGGPDATMIIERFDVNQDGTITRDEVATANAEKVKAFDRDGDGALSLDEYKALWTDAMNRAIVRAFQFHDPDGDAKVTLEEYSESFDRLFARFDRDGDGVIAADEFGPPRGGDRPTAPPGLGPGGPGGAPGMGPGGPGGPDGPGQPMVPDQDLDNG